MKKFYLAAGLGFVGLIGLAAGVLASAVLLVFLAYFAAVAGYVGMVLQATRKHMEEQR